MIRSVAELKGGVGNGTSGGVTDDWKASVDQLCNILTAIGWQAPAGIVLGLGIWLAVYLDILELE